MWNTTLKIAQVKLRFTSKPSFSKALHSLIAFLLGPLLFLVLFALRIDLMMMSVTLSIYIPCNVDQVFLFAFVDYRYF